MLGEPWVIQFEKSVSNPSCRTTAAFAVPLMLPTKMIVLRTATIVMIRIFANLLFNKVINRLPAILNDVV